MTRTTPSDSPTSWHRNRFRHFVNRPRLSFAVMVFLLVLIVSPGQEPPAHRLLLAFNAAATAFLLLTFRMMLRANLTAIQRQAAQHREGRWVVLGVSLVVALATLMALGLELHSKNSGSFLQVLLSVSTIVLTWVFVNTTFALHYAHDYHDRHAPALPGLVFPGGEEPDYWDFMYFAFVLGMTFQVSDVQIASRPLRRFALLHGVLAFFFNVVIIALTVNVIAGLG